MGIQYFLNPESLEIHAVELGERSVLGLKVTYVETKAVEYYGVPDEFLEWCFEDMQSARTVRKQVIIKTIRQLRTKLDAYCDLLFTEYCEDASY